MDILYMYRMSVVTQHSKILNKKLQLEFLAIVFKFLPRRPFFPSEIPQYFDWQHKFPRLHEVTWLGPTEVRWNHITSGRLTARFEKNFIAQSCYRQKSVHGWWNMLSEQVTHTQKLLSNNFSNVSQTHPFLIVTQFEIWFPNSEETVQLQMMKEVVARASCPK